MFSINPSNTLLVSSFHQLVESLQNSDQIESLKSTSAPIQIVNYKQPSRFQEYSLWNYQVSPPNSFTTQTMRSSSIGSSRSISPTSSLEAPLYNNKQVSKKQLPSSKTQFDVSKCIEKSVKILKSNPEKVIMCSFCKNNGEPEHIWRSHNIKDVHGKVTCPLLQVYKCPACGETGQNAHTITYCKKFKAQKRKEILSNQFK